MTPQPKGEVPEHLAQGIREAQARLTAAKDARDEAIVAALLADGSVREVARVACMSASQIQIIGHAGGWPSARQQRERDQRRAATRDWQEQLDRASKFLADLEAEGPPVQQ